MLIGSFSVATAISRLNIPNGSCFLCNIAEEMCFYLAWWHETWSYCLLWGVLCIQMIVFLASGNNLTVCNHVFSFTFSSCSCASFSSSFLISCCNETNRSKSWKKIKNRKMLASPILNILAIIHQNIWTQTRRFINPSQAFQLEKLPLDASTTSCECTCQYPWCSLSGI